VSAWPIIGFSSLSQVFGHFAAGAAFVTTMAPPTTAKASARVVAMSSSLVPNPLS
jgi:hypothetical protein